MKQCPKCGHQLSDDCVFCTECGTKIPQGLFCPKCGASVAEGSSFCHNCGAKTAPQTPPRKPVYPQQPVYQKKSGFSPLFIIIPIIGVVILGMLAVGGWLLYGKFMQDSQGQDITLATLDYDTNGYSYTDLGLSVMWADYNVGASSPEESGNLYGWGNTNLNLSTDLYRYPKSDPPYNISGTEYDVAKQLWGGDWRMPTLSELRELQDRCSWEVVEYAVGTFCRVTGPNGNSILLPLDGYKKGSEIKSVGEWGFIWSSVLYEGNNQMAANLSFSRKGHVETSGYFRYGGESIRPVMDKK